MSQVQNKSRSILFKLLSILFAIIYLTNANAVSNKKGFTIHKDAVLTIKLLDSCWQNRENIENQKMIISFLQTKPSVSEDYQIAWKTSRLVYFIGNFGVGESQFVETKAGIKLFDYGVKAGELAVKLNQDGVEGHYWYAVNLGSWGLANGIITSAIHAKDGMKALKKAMAINPAYNWYGSSRVLGRYYQELPRIFGGDSTLAEELFISATKNAPEVEVNWLYLGRYYNTKGKYKEALEACQKAVSIEKAVDGVYESERYKKESEECVKKAQGKLS